jgi:hypothetical protein
MLTLTGSGVKPDVRFHVVYVGDAERFCAPAVVEKSAIDNAAIVFIFLPSLID